MAKSKTIVLDDIIDKHMSCTCIDAYKLRAMADPNCCKCEYYEDIRDMMEEFADIQNKPLQQENDALWDVLRVVYEATLKVGSNAEQEWDAFLFRNNLNKPNSVQDVQECDASKAPSLVPKADKPNPSYPLNDLP